MLEWAAHASVLGQRSVERFACGFDGAASLAQQRAAAGGGGERPRTAGACGEVFVALEPCLRLLVVAGADHRLDRIRPCEVCWFPPAVRIQPGRQGAQFAIRRPRVSAREREEAEHSSALHSEQGVGDCVGDG